MGMKAFVLVSAVLVGLTAAYAKAPHTDGDAKTVATLDAQVSGRG